jgi:hypothetical protein
MKAMMMTPGPNDKNIDLPLSTKKEGQELNTYNKSRRQSRTAN